MLKIKGFTKSYSGNQVLKIDNLDLGAGLYWVQGDNGSGKTTFFRSMAGLLPCQGHVGFSDGVGLHQTPVKYRMLVNYAEAEPIYPGFLTALDLLSFVGQAKRAPQGQITSLIKNFGIAPYANNPCETYSSGMLKKLSLAISFLGSPRMILLDEPIITLDAGAKAVLFDLINKFLQKKDTLIFVSSHQEIKDDLAIHQTFRIRNKNLEPA